MNEGLKDNIKKEFPEHEELIEKLSTEVKPKFLRWATERIFLDQEPKEEVVQLLRHFERVQQRLEKRDINAYESLGDLRGAIESLGTSKRSERQLVKEDSDDLGTVKTEEGDILRLIAPKSREAAIAYGAGTRWCISATKSKNYFNDYSSQDIVFVFVINPNSRKDLGPRTAGAYMDKVAFAVPREWEEGDAKPFINRSRIEIFNSADKRIDNFDMNVVWGVQATDQVVSTVLSYAESRPVTEESDITTTSDIEKLRKWINAGKDPSILLRNPKFPSELIPEIFELAKTPEDIHIFLDGGEREIPIQSEVIRMIISKFGPAADGIALLLFNLKGSLSNDILRDLAIHGNQATKIQLGKTPNLTSEQIDWLIDNGDDETIAEIPFLLNEKKFDKTAIDYFWKKIVSKEIPEANKCILWWAKNYLIVDAFQAVSGLPECELDLDKATVELVGSLYDTWKHHTEFTVDRPQILRFLEDAHVMVTPKQIKRAYDIQGLERVRDAISNLLASRGLLK